MKTAILTMILALAIVTPSQGTDIWGDAQTDQERCEAEAAYMAAHRAFRHVGPCIGRFEGIGYRGRTPNLGTCRPHRNRRMRLTGDAVAQCSDGTWVRVRSWR